MTARILRFIQGKPAQVSPAELHAFSRELSEAEKLKADEERERRAEEADKLTAIFVVGGLVALVWVSCR